MKRRPDAKFYLLDPRSIWNLWKALHVYTGLKIRQNPPSSGFIGQYFSQSIPIAMTFGAKCIQILSMTVTVSLSIEFPPCLIFLRQR